MAIRFERIEEFVKKKAQKYINLREHLHAHPELGRLEFKTSEHLKDILRTGGYEAFDMVGPTGFITDLTTDINAPWIALRTDMDALPIKDLKNVPYKSTNEGVCHSCGHDFHSAVVAGVAETLAHFKKYLRGNIRFIFQHAEEPIPGGAIDFVRKGKLKGINAVFGLHADPEIAAGHIGLRSGWINAQSIQINIKIDGPGGHSARPQETSDPIYLGTNLLNTLYSFISRKLNPEIPFVFTIGKVNAGDSYNSIARSFEAEGTLRVTDEKSVDDILKKIEVMVKKITVLEPVSTKFEYIKGAPPVINNNVLTKQVRDIIEKVIPADCIHKHERSMGGEDFSSYLRQAPGVFIRFGVGNEKKITKLHTGEFDIDNRAIPFGISVYSWIIIKMLENMTN